jgi:hypothetical protein
MKMSLQDLVGKSLDQIAPAAETVQRLLEGAARHIADSKVTAISAETRFVSAYTAIRMLADAGLNANGYRTRSSVPGHHVIAIRALGATLGIDEHVIARLDKLRQQRNATEYSGDLISRAAVAECIRQAQELQKLAIAWLQRNRPELLK